MREFIRSIYDGQLFVNLQKGAHFPGLDLWGTSDPYVVFRIGDCSVRSRTIWEKKLPENQLGERGARVRKCGKSLPP
ncbi:unnamed protein product [Calypogeia fissa]